MPESLPKRFVFLVLTFLSHVPQHSCIDVITSERNKMPQEDGHFVIPGLDLNSLNTFTMCGRFNIYQFIVHSEVINRTYEYEAYTEAQGSAYFANPQIFLCTRNPVYDLPIECQICPKYLPVMLGYLPRLINLKDKTHIQQNSL